MRSSTTCEDNSLRRRNLEEEYDHEFFLCIHIIISAFVSKYYGNVLVSSMYNPHI